MHDLDLREKLGENARKRVEERFDAGRNINQYIELFSGKLERKNEPMNSDYRYSTRGQEIKFLIAIEVSSAVGN
jgi:hypothetical protein